MTDPMMWSCGVRSQKTLIGPLLSLFVFALVPFALVGQRQNTHEILGKVNSILAVAAVDSPPPTVHLRGDSALVFVTAWDSTVSLVRKTILIRDIGQIIPRAVSRPGEPLNYRLEITVSCRDPALRCVRVLSPADSVVGLPQRIRFTVWRDSPEALELTSVLRQLVQSMRRQDS